MEKLYVAYGSNLNLEQMAFRCPSAKVYGRGVIEGYKLFFNRVASIAPEVGGAVPCAVWEIDDACEKSLDVYEGYPLLYRKEEVVVTMHDGKKVKCMAYVMNKNGRGLPTKSYYDIIVEGYKEVGLDLDYLRNAVLRG